MRRSLRLSLIVAAIVGIASTAGLAQRTTPAIRFGTPGATGPVPAPKDVFGFAPGDDYKLASHEQLLDYFAKLDASSDRISVERIGKSSEGRDMIVAIISSEVNLKNRARYQDIARRLSLARGVSEPEARSLSKEGKVIVWIDGGLHATEVAGAQHTPELAWWLVSSESDEAKRVRDNAILVLMPSMNPDGLDIVRDWYYKNLGTPFETTSPPDIYHHYVGHDNNRDWTMFTQVETQAVARQLYHVWYPQIVYNHHQSGPFPSRIWGPPMKDPVNPNLDPLVVSTINSIGEAMRKRFDEEEKPGYSSHMLYDIWWNGSMRGGPDYHNMAGFLTETSLYRMATPHCYTAEEIPETFGERHKNLPAKIPSVNYTNPWLGGCWPFRKPVEYMLTASRATLDLAAKTKEDFLYNTWRMGTRQIARGERAEGGPFAYVIDPSAQHDQTRMVDFLRTFRIANIEVRQADAPFTAGGKEYPAGTYVLGPSSYRPYVVDLIDEKKFPERRLYPGGPPDPPYDMTGYELSYQMGIKIDRVKDAFALPSKIVTAIASPDGGVTGTGAAYALSPNANWGVRAINKLLKNNAHVSWAPDNRLIVEGTSREDLEKLGVEFGVFFTGLDAVPAGVKPIRTPRIALYRSNRANMDEGWTRWMLEQYGFAYTTVRNPDVRSGDLSKFDVLLFADEADTTILNGAAAGTMPPDFVGGIGMDGAANVRRFVERGGWVVAWDRASDFAILALDLPLRNSVRDTRPEEFFIPGSLLRINTKPAHPLAAGMEASAVAMFADSQAFQIIAPAAEGKQRATRDVDVYVEYPRQNFMVSGWELGGARYLAGRVAAAHVQVGNGHAVIMGFRPHWRGQPHNTFKLLFNPLFLSTIDGGLPIATAVQ
jgi:hypothetical protein